jgi:hypothetical protein
MGMARMMQPDKPDKAGHVWFVWQDTNRTDTDTPLKGVQLSGVPV